MMIRKSLTATVAATLVLGSVMAPSAMAKKGHGYPEKKKAIFLNGTLVSQPMGLVAPDPNTHRSTTYMPIWYVLQALKTVGVQYTWNGHDLNIIPAPGMTVSLSNLHPGNENVHLSVNGKLVDTAVRIVAKDPYSGVDTTYIPIWYVQYVLRHLGVDSTWNGTSWHLMTHVNGVQKLSLSAADDTVGVGRSDTLTAVATYSDGSTATLQSSQVKWTTNDPNGAFVSPSQQFIATKPGTYTVTAAYRGVTQSIVIHVYGGTASIQMKADGALVANGVSTQTVTVQAVDGEGIPAQGENGTVLVSGDQPWIVTGVADGKNELGKSVTVQLKNGVGTVNIQAPRTPGLAMQLTASNLSDVPSTTTIQYGTLQISSVQQVPTALSIHPANGEKYLVANQAGNKVSFDVQVNDQAGEPMLSGSYPYSITVSGHASYTGPTTGVYLGGREPSTITVESRQGDVGPVSVTVSSNGLTASDATLQAIISAQANKLVAAASDGSSSFAEGGKITFNLTAEDQNGVPTTFPSTPLTVYVLNAQGQPATDIQVNGVTQSSTGVALGSNHSVTLSDTTKGAHAGTYSVSIRDASGQVWVSFQVRETAAEANKLVLASSASELQLAHPTTTLTLQYTDAYGNPTGGPAGAGNVTVTASGGQGAATVDGQNATQGVRLTPDATGKVSATFSAQPYAGSTWKLRASDGRLTSNDISVSVVSALVSQATVSLKDSSTGSTTQATAGDGLQVGFGALDSYNNPYGGNDTFATTFPTVALRGVSDGVNSSGVTTVTGTLSQLTKDFAHAQVATAQTLTIQLADQSVNTAKSGTGSITVVPGPFKGFAVFDQHNQLISSSNPLQITSNAPVEVWVRPVDAMDNAVGAVPTTTLVDLATSGGTGSFRLSPAGSDMKQVTFPTGTAVEPLYYVNSNGSYVLTAAISTVDPSHSSVKLTSYKQYQSKPVAEGTGTLTVVLRDQQGLPITGQSSNLSASSSSRSVVAGSFTESSDGTYTAQVKSTAHQTGVVITVKAGGTWVGATSKFDS